MNEFKGTKGNWDDKFKSSTYVEIRSQNDSSKPIAVLESYYYDKEVTVFEELSANALLISKAPEMLEALQEFCDRVEKGEVRSTKTYNKFKELIKSATELK